MLLCQCDHRSRSALRFDTVFTQRPSIERVCANVAGGGGTTCLDFGSALWWAAGDELAFRFPWTGLLPPVPIDSL